MKESITLGCTCVRMTKRTTCWILSYSDNCHAEGYELMSRAVALPRRSLPSLFPGALSRGTVRDSGLTHVIPRRSSADIFFNNEITLQEDLLMNVGNRIEVHLTSFQILSR